MTKWRGDERPIRTGRVADYARGGQWMADLALLTIAGLVNVLPPGQPLPPFRGQQWVLPGANGPAFWFWKKLG